MHIAELALHDASILSLLYILFARQPKHMEITDQWDGQNHLIVIHVSDPGAQRRISDQDKRPSLPWAETSQRSITSSPCLLRQCS